MHSMQGYIPKLIEEGESGAYLMWNPLRKVYTSVFKPRDEEIGAENNPKYDYDPADLRKGTTPGRGWIMEVNAYLLDYPTGRRRQKINNEVGFSGVPPTFSARCSHQNFNNPRNRVQVKIGSIQLYMKNNGSLNGFSSHSFSDHEVHKIAVFDIRMANADRHRGNILYVKETGLLIPIDHACILPTSFEGCKFAWRDWEQAKRPFNHATAKYIDSMDAQKDIDLLKYWGYNLPSGRAMTLRISTMLLKKGVALGFTPSIIGNLMCRMEDNINEKSVIEKIVEKAGDFPPDGVDVTPYMNLVSDIMDHRLRKIQRSL